MHPIDSFAPTAILVLCLLLAGLILWDPVTKWVRRRRS